MRVSPHTARIAHTAALAVTATGVNISSTVIVAPRIVVVAADDVVAIQMMTWIDRLSFILTAGQPGGTPRLGEGGSAPRTAAAVHR